MHFCSILIGTAFGDGYQLIVLHFPTIAFVGGGVIVGRVIYKVFYAVYAVMVGIVAGYTAVGAEIHLTVGGTNAAAFDFKKVHIGNVVNPYAEIRIVMPNRTGNAVHIIGNDTAGFGAGIVTAHGDEDFVVIVVKTLLNKRGNVLGGTVDGDIGQVHSKKQLQRNGAGGLIDAYGGAEDAVTSFTNQGDVRVADRHDTGSGKIGGGAVVGHIIVTDLGQSGAVYGKANQTVVTGTCGAGGNKHGLYAANGGNVQVVGMGKLVEIVGAVGTVGHPGDRSVRNSGSGDSSDVVIF